MRACSSASGGVMFIPDDIEEKDEASKYVSYRDLAEEKDEPKKRRKLFGLKRKKDKVSKAA